MNVGTVYQDVSALLDDYLESLGMRQVRGPLPTLGLTKRHEVVTYPPEFQNW
jgi:hypothetical protein